VHHYNIYRILCLASEYWAFIYFIHTHTHTQCIELGCWPTSKIKIEVGFCDYHSLVCQLPFESRGRFSWKFVRVFYQRGTPPTLFRRKPHLKTKWQIFFLQNETVFCQVRAEADEGIEHLGLSIVEAFKRCRFGISSRAISGRSTVNLLLFRGGILAACVRTHGGFLYLRILYLGTIMEGNHQNCYASVHFSFPQLVTSQSHYLFRRYQYLGRELCVTADVGELRIYCFCGM